MVLRRPFVGETDIHIDVCMHIYFYELCLCTKTYTHVCLPKYMYIYAYIHMYVCMHLCDMCPYVHTYMAAYIHI